MINFQPSHHSHHPLALNFPKITPLEDDALLADEKKNRKEILNNNYTQKLQDYIKFQMNIDNTFYPLWQMFEISSQIIGKKGWDKINTERNVKRLLNKLEVEIVNNSSQ